jgi:hypothetical protein
MKSRLVILFVAATVLNCSREEPAVHTTARVEQPMAVPDSLRQSIQRLGTLEGSFYLLSDSSWTFLPESPLFAAIESYGDQAVSALVSCLDDIHPAAATVNGRPVYVGVMCYEALRRFVYYEYWDSDIEGYSPDWLGYIAPTAGPADLHTAKQMWLVVLRNKAYRLG